MLGVLGVRRTASACARRSSCSSPVVTEHQPAHTCRGWHRSGTPLVDSPPMARSALLAARARRRAPVGGCAGWSAAGGDDSGGQRVGITAVASLLSLYPAAGPKSVGESDDGEARKPHARIRSRWVWSLVCCRAAAVHPLVAAMATGSAMSGAAGPVCSLDSVPRRRSSCVARRRALHPSPRRSPIALTRSSCW